MRALPWLRPLARDAAGVASIEFALAAPLLIGGLLMMVDGGIAISTRMEMDRNVRAGAQAAMSLNNDAASIRAIVLASADLPDDMEVDVQLVCLCAGEAAACTTPCPSGEEPQVLYDISASRIYSGIVVGDLTLRSHTSVQLR
jgi:hypothetical protein